MRALLAALAALACARAEPRRVESPAGVDVAPVFGPAPVSGYIVQDGSGPPPFRVADQERLAAALPACPLARLDPGALSTVPLRPYAATVRLPDARAATDEDVPDSTGQAWRRPDGARLIVSARRRPELPGLHALEGPGPGGCGLRPADRPMPVGFRTEPRRGGGTWHRAWVSGFLDDTTEFFVDVIAPSAGRRDSLLAALGTLRRAGP